MLREQTGKTKTVIVCKIKEFTLYSEVEKEKKKFVIIVD